MDYHFDILGVTSILEVLQTPAPGESKAYLTSPECSLDRVLASLTDVTQKHAWDYDALAQIVINYWLRQAEAVQRWQQRLLHLGQEGVLVARVTHVPSLREELEQMLRL